MSDILFKKIKLNEKETKKFLIIFYIIGTIGFLIPFFFRFFIFLTPFVLLTNFFILIYFDKNIKNKKKLFVFLSIYIISFLIELAGVQTKAIFGDYSYGKGLGLKLFDTPLLIGLNWLFLVYSTSSVIEKFKIHSFLKVIISSVMMLIYDLILEQIAPIIDMWSWKNDIIPLKNYIVWFILALIFNSSIKIFNIKTENKLSFTILICQFLFFLFLFISYRFII